jgi:ABC-type lipoprotein export system ATPase subunit
MSLCRRWPDPVGRVTPCAPILKENADGAHGVTRPTETPEARATRLLKRVGLGERLHHRPGQLSGGERQRVAVVRALINQPQLLLADEPTGSLDHSSATSLGQLLVELNREEGVTLIIVTHALELAKQMGRVLELRDGKTCFDDDFPYAHSAAACGFTGAHIWALCWARRWVARRSSGRSSWGIP